jgi:hypothetical protein
MPAPNGPQFALYHGTGGGIEGGVVRPHPGVFGVGAYATADQSEAELYAKTSAKEQGRLFGTVYEVEPTSQATKHAYPHEMYGKEPDGSEIEYFKDEQGMKAIRPVSYPSTYDVEYVETPTQRRSRLIDVAANTAAQHQAAARRPRLMEEAADKVARLMQGDK